MDWFDQDNPSIINGALVHSSKYLSFLKFYGHLNNEKLFISSQVVDSWTVLIIVSFEFWTM